MGENSGKAPYSLVVLYLWKVHGPTQLKPKVASDKTLTTRGKRATAHDWIP